MSEPVLKVDNVSVSFGGVHALKDVKLDIAPGARVGLIGPNGAGKTTLIKCIAGNTTPDRGAVFLNGTPLGNRSAAGRARDGVARTFQNLELFDSMSVFNNVLVTLDGLGFENSSARSRRERTNDVLERFGISSYADIPVNELPYGIRKLTELSRAFVSAPKLVLLDEPVAGLADTEAFIDTVIEALDELGCATLLVEHDMSTIERVCDEVYVLDAGEIIAHGSYTEVSTSERVIHAYLGVPD